MLVGNVFFCRDIDRDTADPVVKGTREVAIPPAWSVSARSASDITYYAAFYHVAGGQL
jgi:hypothetical protein